MKKFLVIMFLLLIPPVFAKQTKTVKKYDFSEDYVPIVSEVTVPKNRVIHSKLNSSMVSNQNTKDEVITTQLTQDWKYMNKVIAPEGSVIYGNIKRINKAGYFSSNGKITIVFTKIIRPDGSEISIKSKPIIIKNSNGSQIVDFATKVIAFPIIILASAITQNADVGTAAFSVAYGFAAGGTDFITTKGSDVVIPLGTEFRILVKNKITVLPYEY